MDKKGLNFLVGLGGLWLLWKFYSIGWLHKVGFLAIDYTVNSNLVNSYSLGEDVYMTTPLALFATLLIDIIAVFGSLIILSVSGIWELLMQSGSFFQDLLKTLKDYLDGFKKEIPIPLPEPVKDPVNPDNVVPEITPEVKENINPLEIILLELKSLNEKQNILNNNQTILKDELEKLKDKPNG